MPGLLKIDNIMYRVADLDKAANVYSDLLGIKQVWRDDEAKMIGLQLAENENEIVLHNDPSLPDFDFSYSVDDVEEFISNATQGGFSLLEGPIDVRTGKYAVLADQDGNKIPIIDLTKFGGVPRFDN